MTLGSLFSGIGGLDLGFEWAGFEVRWQVEREPFCRAVLAQHWPGVPCFDDVHTVGAQNLEPVDVIIGGFPCQDVSDAGLRAGIDGARSGLWREYHRIIRELRPRIVVIENVRGLLVRGIDRVLGDLADIGYDAEWTRVRAADVGAPHRRERIFILAYPQSDAGRDRQQRVERRAAIDGQEPRETGQRRLADAASLRRDESARATAQGGSANARSGDAGIVPGRSEGHRGRHGIELADAGDDGREQRSTTHDDHGCDARRDEPHGRGASMADTASGGQREQRREPGASSEGAERHADGGREGRRLEHADLSGQGVAREGNARREREPGRHAATRAGYAGELADAAVSGLEGRRRYGQPGCARPHIDDGSTRVADPTELLSAGGPGQADFDAARPSGAFRCWPARPGEVQQGWEPPRVLRRAESGVGVVPDGLPAGLVRHRRRALAALGNAVVPQVAYLVALRVRELMAVAEVA